ncbi:MAG: O-antigen ligase family protein [bacterium]|nr:O-antigen ligase family protein [bacterium]
MSSTERSENNRFRNIFAPSVLAAIPLVYVLVYHPNLENILLVLIMTALVPVFFIDFKLGFFVLIALRPTLDVFGETELFALGPFPFNLSSVVGILVIVWGLWYFFTRKVRFWRQPLFWPFAIVTGLSVISLFYTPSNSATIRESVRFLSIFVMYLMAGSIITSAQRFSMFLGTAAVSLIIPLAVGAYQFLSGTGLSFGGLDNRVYATLGHPNAFGFYLVLLLGIGLGYFFSRQAERSQKLILAGLTVLCLFLILTYTRGAWLAFLFVFILFGIRYYKKLLIVLAAFALAVLLLSPVINRASIAYFDYDFNRNPLVQRLSDDSNIESSIDWRFGVWSEMSAKIGERPLFGYGLGAFPVIRQQYVKGFFESTEAHNDYLRLAIELGVIGLGVYMILLGTLLYSLWRKFRANISPAAKAWMISGVGLAGALMVMSFSDNVLQGTAAMWLFWSFQAGLLNAETRPTIK